jgi:excisionase family DNA binding protein
MSGEAAILSVSEAAGRCGVNRASIWRWIKTGRLRAARTAGGHHRILAEDLEAFMARNAMEPRLRHPDRSARILVVDDEPIFQKFMIHLLEGAGYLCETASDGFEAGVKTVTFRPHLIVLDLFMPNMDGFEVCRQIRRNPKTASIRVIAVSGMDTDANRMRILECGADLFLPKPTDTGLLKGEIARLLGPPPGGGGRKLLKCRSGSPERAAET